jgi:predicted nucleotidyltransferase
MCAQIKKIETPKIKLDRHLVKKIISILVKNFEIESIILFGSYVYGNPNENSDIDIVVILKERGFARDYEDLLSRRLKISSLFLDIKKIIPMDILVYTKDEWEKLLNLNSSFIREVNEKGVRLK